MNSAWRWCRAHRYSLLAVLWLIPFGISVATDQIPLACFCIFASGHNAGKAELRER